jgi:phosphoribosylaminoimidazolecarboxamide formyltransferase/IMP cyclohydrolase
MSDIQIRSALVSVYNKVGLDDIIRLLKKLDITIYSTGGTQQYIESLGAEVISVESLTDYPSILDGRVKTLHPKVFGGILARREAAHLEQLTDYDIPPIDLVIVDLYPFEQTLRETKEETRIIEKIDIGGISLIRAAAKNYQDVAVIASQEMYPLLHEILLNKGGNTTLEERRQLAMKAFAVSSHYDTLIHGYFLNEKKASATFDGKGLSSTPLRYGENPHQQATFFGDLSEVFDQLAGKELSFNNLVDIDAAMVLMREFEHDKPAFAILKHTNSCGVAIRDNILDAWKAALAGDPVSAFGGILISNREIDMATAAAVDEIFYEVLMVPGFAEGVTEVLRKKKNRILLKINAYPTSAQVFKSLLNGVIRQDADLKTEEIAEMKSVTIRQATGKELSDMRFANICVKHLKSNGIALVRDNQLIGMGCGQTSRIDALQQAIAKARKFGFDVKGSVMASDAFFPFADCVEVAHDAGVTAVIHPGGSMRDEDSIAYCNAHDMAMVITGNRHFKH